MGALTRTSVQTPVVLLGLLLGGLYVLPLVFRLFVVWAVHSIICALCTVLAVMLCVLNTDMPQNFCSASQELPASACFGSWHHSTHRVKYFQLTRYPVYCLFKPGQNCAFHPATKLSYRSIPSRLLLCVVHLNCCWICIFFLCLSVDYP